MTTDERVEATRKTYDRRRARSAADELASVPIDRWDDTTKRIVAALAVHIPGQVTAAELDDAFGPVEEVTPRLFTWDDLPDGTEDIRVAFAAELERMGLTADVDTTPIRDDMCRRQHLHGTPELAAACDALEGPMVPAERRYFDGSTRAEVLANPCIDPECSRRYENHVAHPAPVHDNGDYRA